MENLISLEGAIAIVLCYLPVYLFNKAIVEQLPSITYRTPNRLESVLLIPLGFVYNIFVFWVLVKIFSFFDCTDVIISIRSIADYFISRKSWSESFIFQVFPELAFCYEVDYFISIIFSIFYIFIFVKFFPQHMGRIFGDSTLAINPFQDWIEARGKFKKIADNPNCNEVLKRALKKVLMLDVIKLIFKVFQKPLVFLCWLILKNSYGKKDSLSSRYIRYTSTDKTPDFLEDFTNDKYDYVLDITIENGKMFSAILKNYELNSSDNIEYITLNHCVRWRETVLLGETSVSNKNLVEKFTSKKVTRIPKQILGDNFTIPFRAIQEINVIKIPKNHVFILDHSTAEDAVSYIFEHVKKNNKHDGFVFNRFIFYFENLEETDKGKLQKLLSTKLTFFFTPTYRFVPNRELLEFSIDMFFTSEEQSLFIVEN